MTIPQAVLRHMEDYALGYYADKPSTIDRLRETIEAVARGRKRDTAESFPGPQLKATIA